MSKRFIMAADMQPDTPLQLLTGIGAVKRKVRQTCRPDSVSQLALAGDHSSGHFIAEML